MATATKTQTRRGFYAVAIRSTGRTVRVNLADHQVYEAEDGDIGQRNSIRIHVVMAAHPGISRNTRNLFLERLPWADLTLSRLGNAPQGAPKRLSPFVPSGTGLVVYETDTPEAILAARDVILDELAKGPMWEHSLVRIATRRCPGVTKGDVYQALNQAQVWYGVEETYPDLYQRRPYP